MDTEGNGLGKSAKVRALRASLQQIRRALCLMRVYIALDRTAALVEIAKTEPGADLPRQTE